MNWKALVFILGCIGAVVYAIMAPAAVGFAVPELAKILFFHLPCAFITTGLIIFASFVGLRYLQTSDSKFDVRNAVLNELALVFAVLTMVSGIIFSRFQWNAWWQNDPRQTSFLIVLMLCGAGVALRGGLVDEHKTARAACAYSVATFLPVMFLIFVLPRIMESFHPKDAVMHLSGAYWTGVFYVMALMVWATRYIYVKRVAKLEAKFDDADEVEGVSPYPRAVRPVAIGESKSGDE